MKYIPYKIAVLIFVLLLNGCSDVLDKDPLDEISSGTVWASEDNAMMALYGAYRGNIAYNGEVYGVDDWWGYYGLVFLELASDNALDRRRAGSPFEQLINGTLTTNNGIIDGYWTSAYLRISRSNDVLDNIDKVPMDDSKKERMKAEARFLRATQYFYLSQHFGDVPLVETVLTAKEANNVKKTSKADLANWISKELQEVADVLPRHKAILASERGRASVQAALAFLGRLQLAEKKYTEAAATYKKIIDYNENIIDPNYQTIFLSSNENSDENIFVSTFKEELAANSMAQQAFPGKNGGWCFFCPLSGLFESYQFKNGVSFSYDDPSYDPVHLEKNRDPRLGFTLLCNNTNFVNSLYISHPDSSLATSDATKVGQQTTQTGFLMRKYFDESVAGIDLRKGYGNDFPIIRYAEVLLI